MKTTQEKVKNYIQSRGLNTTLIKELIIEYEQRSFDNETHRCPRCKSDKLLTEEVEWYATNRSAAIDGLFLGTQMIKEKIVCQICGFLIKNPNNEQWIRQTNKSLLQKLISKWL